MIRHGGRILIDQLRLQGCEAAFCVPGESFLAALDGLFDTPSIQTVVCRQEGGAAMMAEAWGKLTGRPGIAFVTRGPGATNAASGVHVARQDSTPMILFVGQVGRSDREREAFQEVDYRRMYGELAKWVGEVDSVERIPEYISHAYHRATSGRPGPVVLALPEDVLSATAEVGDTCPAAPVEAKADDADVAAVAAWIERAERPLMIVGGSGWTAAAARDLGTLTARFDLPVATAFRRQDYLDNDHPCFAGDLGPGVAPKLAARVRACDLLIAVGTRLGEMTTSGYGLLSVPETGRRFVHVHAGAEELGRVYRPDRAVNASSASFLAKLARLAPERSEARAAWRAALRAEREDWIRPEETPGAVKMERVIGHLREALPIDAILANGAGNYATFVHRYFAYRRFGTQLAPTSGSMGYGLPAAIAAKLRHPDRAVVAVAGDGCFLMTGQEMATAVRHEANIVVLVADNGMYGTIRMHQERTYPGRESGTSLANPDFAALARSYGAFGATVERTEDFPDAFEEASSAGRPALVHLKLDPEALTTRASLSAIRSAALGTA